jgi:hypothetical protein
MDCYKLLFLKGSARGFLQDAALARNNYCKNIQCNCNLTPNKSSYLYYALLPLHPVPACCGFNNRAYWRIYIELPPHPLLLDTGSDPCHIGHQ